MKTLRRKAAAFLRSENGPSATEYAVLLGLIAIVVLGVMATFGQNVNGLYVTIRAATANI